MNIGKKFLSDLKLHSDYLKWIENEGRYETWEDACESIINGHREHYKYVSNQNKLNEFLDESLLKMKEKTVLASQRSLQFRNEQIEKHNTRIYNCSSMYGARNRIFQEVFYLGLSGCGVGTSLLIPFVDNISKLQKRKNGTKTFVVPDSIEGWADALGVLMSSYFVDKQPFPEYAGYEIKFDYSLIRPKGSYINGGFKAPGHEGLKQSLEKIESLVENWIITEGTKVRPILVLDILCIAADAVLSGSVRRSALNMILDPNDKESINAKIGNWRTTHPHRARSNNSVLLLRSEVTKENFTKIVELNDGMSDIGFVFANSWFDSMNPCFTGDMELLTSSGYKKFSDFTENEHVTLVNAIGQEVSGYVRKSGYKDVVEIKLTTGKSIICTPDHILLDVDGNEIEARNSKGIQLAHYLNHNGNYDDLFVKLGFIQKDEILTKINSTDHKGLEICFNPKDYEVSELFEVECATKVYVNGYNDILKKLKFNTSKLPETYKDWSEKEQKSFLRGLFSANSSILKTGRITLKSTSKELIDSLVEIFTNWNVNVYYTTNKEKEVEFKNGTYTCKESYDLNFASYESLVWFYNNIGFVQSYKVTTLLEILKVKAPKVKSVIERKNKEIVYDFELDDLLHVGVVNGLLVHNCFEILMLPILYNGDLSAIKYEEIKSFIKENENNIGVAFCNLTEINAEHCTTRKEFLEACEAGSVLGTIQAGYTKFPYLGETTEKIVQKEALLGVSITGWMNNPMLFDPTLLKEGAETVKSINKEVARLIGINQAARTTCVDFCAL